MANALCRDLKWACLLIDLVTCDLKFLLKSFFQELFAQIAMRRNRFSLHMLRKRKFFFTLIHDAK